MNLRRGVNAQPSRAAVDAVIDAYVGWREASAAVAVAYRGWNASLRGEREAAFVGYIAALDREERAADRYRSLLERVSGGGAEWDGDPVPVDRAA
jgi:hypothetical protein